MIKDEQEIQDMRDDAARATMHASKWPGMSYEEGVRNALEWVLGDLEDDLLP